MTAGITQAASVRPPTERRGFLGLAADGLRDLRDRRQLVRYIVSADLKRTHADSVIGQLWWVLDPLLQMAVYFVLVSVIFQRDVPAYPLFLFAAILPWKWFNTTLNDAALSVTNRQSLIRQLPFPKIVLPASATIAATVSFAFGLVALAIVYLFFLDRLSLWVLTIPLVAVVQFVFTLALAVFVSAVNAFYRDVQNVLRHVLRLWFYLSPALYSLDQLRDHHPLIVQLLSLNPFAVLFEGYRAATWGTRAPDALPLLVLLLISSVLLVLAMALFKRVEPAFARIL